MSAAERPCKGLAGSTKLLLDARIIVGDDEDALLATKFEVGAR
jgi:hypothetical protein